MCIAPGETELHDVTRQAGVSGSDTSMSEVGGTQSPVPPLHALAAGRAHCIPTQPVPGPRWIRLLSTVLAVRS